MNATPDEHSDGPNDRAPVSSREKAAAAVREPIPGATATGIPDVSRAATATAITAGLAPAADEGHDTERAVPGAAAAGAAAEQVSSSWWSS